MANIYTDIAMFDAELYLAKNPDVAAAIEGTEITAQDHYFSHGAAESLTNNDRAPNAWFNAAEYKAQNPDLADVDANLLLAHFALHGVNEGRAPNAATAGEDGKIKPELLNDYVNAEGNADVKAAIAEMTGEEVGAELTAEQATIAMQHFFNHGINDSREGGIADVISNDAGVDLGDVVKAVENYQDKLDAQDAAVAAQQKAADEAVKAGLSTQKKAEGDKKYDAAKVKGEVDTEIANLENAIRKAAVVEEGPNSLLPSSLEVNGKSIAFVEDAQASALATAQKQVDLLKAQNAKVVALQEKLVAYKAVATEINKTVIDFEAALGKFNLDNGAATATNFKFVAAAPATGEGDDATPATPAAYSVVVNGLTLTFDAKGKLVVKAADGKDAAAADIAALNKLEGIEDLKAALTTTQGNVAAQAAADKAIKDALIAALKAEGFKAYKADDTKGLVLEGWDKAIVDGQLAAGVTLHTAVKKDATGKKVVADTEAKGYKTIAANAALYEVKPIVETDGKVASLEAAKLNGTTFPDAGATGSEIGVAAAQSKAAVEAVADLEALIKAFNEAVANHETGLDLQKQLEQAAKDVKAAGDAVTKAEEAFAKLDVNLVVADKGEASGEVYDEDDAEQLVDLFVFSNSLKVVDNFDGEDLLFFGDAAANLVVVAEDADLTKGKLGGDANVLDIFVVQEDGETVLYVEKVAFAGNSANPVNVTNKDFVKIELAGVNADDLQLEDGFLTLA